MHSFEIDENRFRKQIRFSPIGNAGQESLRRGRVAIVGLGRWGPRWPSDLFGLESALCV